MIQPSYSLVLSSAHSHWIIHPLFILIELNVFDGEARQASSGRQQSQSGYEPVIALHSHQSNDCSGLIP
jgi:hypothetical protein